MENGILKIDNNNYILEYNNEGIDYKLRINYEGMSAETIIRIKTFPYIYTIEEKNDKNEILYIRYIGEENEITFPYFDIYDNYYAPTIYSYNEIITELKFDNNIKNI